MAQKASLLQGSESPTQSPYQLQLGGGWFPAPAQGTACPPVHGGLSRATAQPVGGGSGIWKLGFSTSKFQNLFFWVLNYTLAWLSLLSLLLSSPLCLSLCLNHTTLPATLVLEVFVLSNKLLILPLTCIYSSPTHTCLFIIYSFFQQTAVIHCWAPSQGREGQVSCELTGT